ncbi:LamG-like jellyroll fold domain-containing protein [Amycolatopsis sp. cg5]|uniref:LamG-like jellyroll fold domain-containing protein n=1 Tax=Amycolatopsis sp. cg5 TaxID=3238802 RepID=UPI00352523E4
MTVPDAAADQVTAAKWARQGNKKVLLTSKTTETSQTFANPDGSWTKTQYVHPVRVKQGADWTPVDPTLVKRPDGSVGPKATKVDLTLNPGGRGSAATPIVKAGDKGREIGLKWTEDLPAPVLSGPIATYPDVLPGVDLKIKASVEGYTETLVVKTREAAKNPRLAKVPFGLHKKNTSVGLAKGQGRGGKPGDVAPDGIEVKDEQGAVLFNGDATRMWDSSAVGPRREAVMGVELASDKVTIAPDQAFLSDPATQYPVELDPDNWCTTCSKQAHAVVQDGHKDAHNYNATTGALSDLKAGYETEDDAGTSATYIQMDTSEIIGTVVKEASLNTTIIHTQECSTLDTDLWLANPFDASITWRNQPAWVSYISSVNVPNCHDASNVSGQFAATSAVRQAADGGWVNITFALAGSADSPRNTRTWRRFDLNPYLQVKYNSTPNPPEQLTEQHGQLPCVSGAQRPWIFTRNPQLAGQVSDPDGGVLYAKFAVSPGTAAKPGTPHDNSANLVEVGTPGPGVEASAQLAAVPDGWITKDGIYNWSMQVTDKELWSDWTGNCEFYVDTAVPKAPSVAMTGVAPANQGDTASFSITVEMATAGFYDIDRFVYTTDGSEPQTQGSPSLAAVKGTNAGGKPVATANFSSVAVNGNQNLIKVRAVNKAGTPGPNAACVTSGANNVFDGPSCSYHVLPLTPAKNLVGAWAFEDGFADTANSTPENSALAPHPLAANGQVSWVAGYNHGNSWTHPDVAGYSADTKGAFSTDGTGYGTTTSGLLDTTKSFTLAGWAKIADLNNSHTLISQDGVKGSAASLKYSKDANAWSLTMLGSDTANATIIRAESFSPPQVGVWTHLVGTYDSVSRTLTLYVNGVKQKTALATGWASTGPFVIGAAKWNGSRADIFRGQLDDAQAWQRVLSSEEVHNLANSSVLLSTYGLAGGCTAALTSTNSKASGLQGNWALDEATGVTGKDFSDSANNFTFTGGAAWAPGHAGGAVHFDGSTGSGKTVDPVVDTSNSFTVSAWVKPDDLNGYYGVLAQGGAHEGAFQLRYSPDGNRWIFGMSAADQNPADYRWAASKTIPQAGVWTQLTAVFDQPSMQAKLYVNGKLESRVPVTSAWYATGGLTVGSMLGNQVFFKGTIDQVQAWQRALTDDQIAAINGIAYYDSVSQTSGVAAGGVSQVTEVDGAGKPIGCAARFDKSWSGQVSEVRPANFRTDKSFTVEAWVNHAWTPADVTAEGEVDPAARAVFSVDDQNASPFLIGYRPWVDEDGNKHGKWSVLMSSTGSDGDWFIYSDADVTNNTWTHLAATYDAGTATVTLFVNGVAQNLRIHTADATAIGRNNANSVFIGRGTWGGNRSDQWYGDAAGVRVYAGVRRTIDLFGDKRADDPGALYDVRH